MRPRRVHLVPAGDVPPRALSLLAAELPRVLPVAALPTEPLAGADAWAPGPLRSGAVVDALLAVAAAAQEGDWWLGVTDRSLLGEGPGPVMGEATVGGPAAVISLAALHSPDEQRLRHRLVAAAAHELGHLAGLDHCPDPSCALFPSEGLADTDRKGPGLCASCGAAVRTLLTRRA